MQQLERAVAVFCIACICAELTTQLAGSPWAKRCIKTVAGLYILVVFTRALPQTGAEIRAFSLPALSPVSMGSMEDAALTQTRQQLEKTLAQKWQAKTGHLVSVSLVLEQEDTVVSVASAELFFPENTTEAERQQAAAFLQQELKLPAEQIVVQLEEAEQ